MHGIIILLSQIVSYLAPCRAPYPLRVLNYKIAQALRVAIDLEHAIKTAISNIEVGGAGVPGNRMERSSPGEFPGGVPG